MPQGKPSPYLLCYDIADDKRLARIHRTAVENGQPIQYSVFLLIKTEEELESLVRELQSEMDPREDDIRIYPLNNPTRVDTLGQPVRPEGIYLIDTEVRVDFARPELKD